MLSTFPCKAPILAHFLLFAAGRNFSKARDPPKPKFPNSTVSKMMPECPITSNHRPECRPSMSKKNHKRNNVQNNETPVTMTALPLEQEKDPTKLSLCSCLLSRCGSRPEKRGCCTHSTAANGASADPASGSSTPSHASCTRGTRTRSCLRRGCLVPGTSSCA